MHQKNLIEVPYGFSLGFNPQQSQHRSHKPLHSEFNQLRLENKLAIKFEAQQVVDPGCKRLNVAWQSFKYCSTRMDSTKQPQTVVGSLCFSQTIEELISDSLHTFFRNMNQVVRSKEKRKQTKRGMPDEGWRGQPWKQTPQKRWQREEKTASFRSAERLTAVTSLKCTSNDGSLNYLPPSSTESLISVPGVPSIIDGWSPTQKPVPKLQCIDLQVSQ